MEGESKRGISRQLSTGSIRKLGRFSLRRHSSLDPQGNNMRFSFGRQSSMDPTRGRILMEDDNEELENYAPLMVPENLDSTMQLLFMASQGDVKGVLDLLDKGTDVDSIDLDGRTALHIAACEGNVEVVKLLLSRNANIDAHDRWGSSAAVDAIYYGNMEVYEILKAQGAKLPKSGRTPMTVSNPKEVPEYELNPFELQVRKADGIAKGAYQVAKWNGTKVAVKILDKKSHSQRECVNAFRYELTILEKVRHPNIIQFVGAVTQNIPMMIAIEYHPKGDLGFYLQKKGRVSPSKCLRFALDIARGMNYLHECKPDPVVHCDLTPKNILLDNSGLLKVAGFGLIRLSIVSPEKFKLVDHEAVIQHSRIYTAPEIYRDDIFDKSVDVYSFAIILYEMIEGAQPFHSKSSEEAIKLMCLEGNRPSLKKLKSYPSDLKELVEECWSENPNTRPNFADIICRLDNVLAHGCKYGWWKDTLKLRWL